MAKGERSSSIWGPITIGIGLLLIACGFIWQATGEASQWLAEEDAQQYVDSAVALHGQTTHDHEPGEAETPELKQARQAMADSVAKIESARFKQRWLPRILQGVGAVLAAVGVFGTKIAANG